MRIVTILAATFIASATLPAYSQSNSLWYSFDSQVTQIWSSPTYQYDGTGIPKFFDYLYQGSRDGLRELSEQTCKDMQNERTGRINYLWETASKTCGENGLINELRETALNGILQWGQYCNEWAKDYEKYRRAQQLIGGSRSGTAGSYTSSRIPDSGGAGGSEIVPSENVSPRDGFAELARNHPIGTTPATTETRQQVCDPKTVDDAQLKALLANPQVHTRITSLIAVEPSPRIARTERNPRAKRGHAPTDADIARSNSGMSPETANAIGTIIGVGMGVGLSSAGRRGGSSAPSGAAHRTHTRSTPHH